MLVSYDEYSMLRMGFALESIKHPTSGDSRTTPTPHCPATHGQASEGLYLRPLGLAPSHQPSPGTLRAERDTKEQHPKAWSEEEARP